MVHNHRIEFNCNRNHLTAVFPPCWGPGGRRRFESSSLSHPDDAEPVWTLTGTQLLGQPGGKRLQRWQLKAGLTRGWGVNTAVMRSEGRPYEGSACPGPASGQRALFWDGTAWLSGWFSTLGPPRRRTLAKAVGTGSVPKPRCVSVTTQRLQWDPGRWKWKQQKTF